MIETSGTFTSRAVRASRHSASLRTTIPQVIAELLSLRSGDSLLWSIDPVDGQARVTRVPKDRTKTGRNGVDSAFDWVPASHAWGSVPVPTEFPTLRAA
jgi:hypothetical protein